MNPGFKRQAAKELVERMPGVSKKMLGKILYEQNKPLFSSPEDGRDVIRAVTGQHKGQPISEKYLTDKWTGPLNIPEGDHNDYAPFILDARKVGLLYDVHLPYHDSSALNLAVERLHYEQVDAIVLAGDLIDCYQLSDFEKDPRERSFKYEIDTVKAFLQEMRTRFPKARIIYIEGNHEQRFDRYIRKHAPALLDIETITFTELLKLKDFGVEYVGNKRVTHLGKLNIVHGHEFGKSVFSPVNPARGFYMRAKANVIGGHHHQTSEHAENDITGSITCAWSVGCLCDLHPAYMPLNKWNLGFAVVEVDQSGQFSVHNHKIINGAVK